MVWANRLLGLMRRVGFAETMAIALVGQALLDEGSILTDKIEIFYNDRATARYIFEVARHVGLARRFRTKKALHQRKYGFTIVQAGWAKLYQTIGPLPDARKECAFEFLLRHRSTGPSRPVGESKDLLLDLLRNKPMTSRDLCYALGLSGSTIRRHLINLLDRNAVRIIGKNEASRSGKNKSALVWSVASA
jgi:DNA-binding transcriptional ArsR family regulator